MTYESSKLTSGCAGALLLLTGSTLIAASAAELGFSPSETLWYAQPAKNWMTECLPVGNGGLGAMIAGGVDTESVQFNHDTLWTGDEKTTGWYQNFGDLVVDFTEQRGEAENYRRSLDLRTAIHRVNYTRNGVNYQREVFASHPAGVMVFRFQADKPGACGCRIHFKDAHSGTRDGGADWIKISGKLENGMLYEARAKIVSAGGTMAADKDGVVVENADEFTVYLAAGTNYVPDQSKGWRGEDPRPGIQKSVSDAAGKTYDALKKEHVADYQNLYRRFSFDVGTSDVAIASKDTDSRLLAYTEKKTEDPDLEELFLNYGRYLMISSSRPGNLPANLQGLWNNSNKPKWRSDYHSNINVQMNHWPTEPANLAESHRVFIDYLESQKPVYRERTREQYSDVRGWTVRTENGIHGGGSFEWNTPGSAWYAQHYWEHFAFSQDKGYLRSIAYPVLKEVTEHWEDRLIERPDGTLVTPVGWSPEHGPKEEAISYDLQIVHDLFSNYIDAATVLGVDSDYRKKVEDMRSRLLKPKIGKWQQLQEWETDRDNPKDDHRHVSHLFGLHPGRQFTATGTPDLFEAAKVSLAARGDGGTGWSRAWKINFWARLHDGERSHRLLRNLLTYSNQESDSMKSGAGVYPNLLDAHPPFQIDGNFGAVAGLCEMLVQSHTGEIVLLPALPSVWPVGQVKGLRVRGGYELDVAWKDGRLSAVAVRNMHGGGSLKLRSGRKIRDLIVPAGERIVLNGDLQAR